MCRVYETQIICIACHAIQPGVCSQLEYRDPDCEEPCPKPWPIGKPEPDPRLDHVDSSQCTFCQRIREPIFHKNKHDEEEIVRRELARVKTVLDGRAEEKNKRREKRLKRKKARKDKNKQEAEGAAEKATEEPQIEAVALT